LKKTKVRVIQHYYQKASSNETLLITIELPKEGSFYESSIFHCSNCNELFTASDQALTYSNTSLTEIIKHKNCPTCNAKLSDTLNKINRHLNPKIKFENFEWVNRIRGSPNQIN
jgi:hypothetical protein